MGFARLRQSTSLLGVAMSSYGILSVHMVLSKCLYPGERNSIEQVLSDTLAGHRKASWCLLVSSALSLSTHKASMNTSEGVYYVR